MNYKRFKAKARKMISWGSPKEYQDKGSNPNHTPAKKPSWYCKKLKAPHVYIYQSTSTWAISNSKWAWENYKCNGCGKQKSMDVKNDPKGNPVQTVCLDCGVKYKKKEKGVMGVWIGDCEMCGAKQVSCAAAGHDFGIYNLYSTINKGKK